MVNGRTWPRFASIAALSVAVSGCDPVVNIAGANFPAWLVCAIAGAIVAVLMRAVFKEGKLKRKDVFVGTKLWNNNHRPERVRPAFEASLKRLQLDYVDLYSIDTPFAFKAGYKQDPRDENGNVIYDDATTLTNTWKALESLVDEGAISR